jgi:lipid II:glycine glycyltransferase (peptidoglycan interpeptide bridge formation enzyme)
MMKSFLQSPQWGEIQQKLGRKIRRVDDNLIIRHDLPGGFNYLYAPEADIAEGAENFLRQAAKMAAEEKSIFLKIEPLRPFSSLGFDARESGWLQPRKTVFLDLARTEEELLRAMHEKTRYNIRLAEKKGVSVKNTGANNFEHFWNMLEETSQRDKFRLHERRHYEKLVQVRSQNFSNELFFAEYRGEVIAGAIINFYGSAQTATYLHGASSRKYREVMGPSLLHWRIIQEAKSRGFSQYDFGGVDTEKWPGITRFKTGFGGNWVEYPQAVDIVYQPLLYTIYSMARKIF